jgi:orotidine-5'-phosphate decarboxylase
VAELVLALDVTNPDRASKIASACAPHIDALKIGYPLVLAGGSGIIESFTDLDIPLIADFKVADIPNTNRLITGQAFSLGFDAIICQGFVGRDAVTACVVTAHEYGGDCYVVAEMSHPGATEFFGEGVGERIAAFSVECGADGIIAPATRPGRVAALRAIVGDKKIYAPGVGAQGGDPASIAALVDGIIVGRAIYESENPDREAVKWRDLCQ